MSAHRLLAPCSLALLLALPQCGPEADIDAEDPEDEGQLSIGKADGPSFGPCVVQAMLGYLNARANGYDQLRALKIAAAPSKAIIAHRDGPDGVFGTGDDNPYDDLAELDAIKGVGPVVMQRIAAAVEAQCTGNDIDVVFSPQPYESSHLVRVAKLIDSANRSLDIAMYSFSDANISKALQRAVVRGVEVRFLSEEANADHSKPAGSKSAALEALGVNVRYVNKIMHHKFMIVDGPRDDLAAAATASLVTGSANWSNGGGTRYDENTLFLTKQARLVLFYQSEFNRLWAHSSDFIGDATLPFDLGVPIAPSLIPADPMVDALFTSSNFTVKDGSTTFRDMVGNETISAALVKEIKAATTSIHIASGHLRSRPVAEALIAAKAAKPSLDIKIYLDNQEYISLSAHNQQEADLQTCLTAAGSDLVKKQQDCLDSGFLFSYLVSKAGIDLKYKYYCYRWDASYAKQMHNKYFIFDSKTLITGSYNLSDNAEHNTFENMVVLHAPAYSSLIARYEQSFARIWQTDADGALLASLKQKVKTAPVIPLVFDPMALSWQQVNDLKQLISTNCPAINSAPYRQDAPGHQTCPRN
jgi:phosphatidylserine/phosphatidylglycerophosphate/cardiolipin synthase-like enzyme